MMQNGSISKRLRTSGIIIILGLVVEAVSLVWNHPLSFVAFLGIGGLLFAAGIFLYLWAISTAEAPAARAIKGTHAD